MKTLLLLAGQSKRFWPLTEKPLFPIAGKALLSHIVDRLGEARCDDIIFIGSKHNLEDVRLLYPDAVIVEQKNLEQGMRGALLDALPLCHSEDVLVVGGNDIFDVDGYHATIAAGKKDGVDGAILGQKVHRYFPGGYLSVDENRISGIVEKPGEGNEPSDLVNIVCHYHRSSSALLSALQSIDEATDDGFGYERALDTLFKSRTFVAVPYEGTWQAVKYPWHLLSLLPILLSDIKKPLIDPSADIHPSAIINGNVIIEESVRIMPNAVIHGPCFIGQGSIIGNNALVRGSSIGNNCVVGYNTEVKSSILHSHVWTHSTYIGDSVIGCNVSFGGGCVTGNLRLDEGEILSIHREAKLPTGLTKFGCIVGDDCRIGIQVGINPGIKIGRGSFVSGGVYIDRDLPDGTFARMKDGEMEIRTNTSEAPKPQEREKYRKTL